MVGIGRGLVRLLSRRTWWLVLALMWVSGLTTALAFRTDHPHRLAVARGVVGGAFHPIAGRFTADQTRLADCGRRDVRCLEQAFGNLAYEDGPKPALALFDRRRAVDKTVAADCHRIAHMIGSAALAHFHGNVALTYSRGSASCASGYYHGILERAFAGVRSEAGLVRVASSICRGAHVRRRGFLDYQCTHGLGHGLMIQTGYDLPTALAVCGHLQTRWDEVSCTGGVFMENGSTVYGLRSPWLKNDDPIYPCNNIKRRNKASCYLRVTTEMLRSNRFDWRDTAARCARVAARWRRDCFRSYGRDAANYAGGKARAIIRLCRLAGRGGEACLYGAARSVADRDAKVDRAAALCRQATRAQMPSCFAGLGVVVGLLQSSDKGRERTCKSVTRTYAAACARAAMLEIAPDGRGAWG
jgi:hypothetical protein